MKSERVTLGFPVLYIDPPWAFKVYSAATGHGRSAESHYCTMTLDDLKRLPVPRLMAKDCAVFMWATFPTLPQAIDLGAAWGLTYKTCAFLWSKTTKRSAGRFAALDDVANWHMGMGYWSRANTEPCLLFTQGSPKRKSKSVRQLVVAPIGRHSEKPKEVYRRIEALVDGPYCELFARNAYPGWERFGNEVDSTVTL